MHSAFCQQTWGSAETWQTVPVDVVVFWNTGYSGHDPSQCTQFWYVQQNLKMKWFPQSTAIVLFCFVLLWLYYPFLCPVWVVRSRLLDMNEAEAKPPSWMSLPGRWRPVTWRPSHELLTGCHLLGSDVTWPDVTSQIQQDDPASASFTSKKAAANYLFD